MLKAERILQIKSASPQLSVGVLTADLMQLGVAVEQLEQAGVRLLHLDVMDGRIWPKITVGSFFVQGLRTSMLKDVHLLVDKPETQVEHFIKAGADSIAFSVEYCSSVSRTLASIKAMPNTDAVMVGLSLNPSTPVETIAEYVSDIDMVVLLAIGPDSGNSNFISELPQRIAQVRAMNTNILIFVDGAIKKENIAQVAAMGPDVIVTGSAVFDGKDPSGNLQFMLNAIRKA